MVLNAIRPFRRFRPDDRMGLRGRQDTPGFDFALGGQAAAATVDVAAHRSSLSGAPSPSTGVDLEPASPERPGLVRLPGTYPVQADTWLLVATMNRLGLAPGRNVLDLCTGTGAVALAAGVAGAAEVTGVDLSLRSMVNARINGWSSRATVQFVRGDLYGAVAGRRFDLVVSNPPYVPSRTSRPARHTVARCWDGGPDGRMLLDRIIAGARDALVPGGSLLLVHSSVCDETLTLEAAAAHGLTAAVVARQVEPLGPVMRARAAMMRQRGLLSDDAREEELVVIRAVRDRDDLRARTTP